ncbi:MAG: glycogen synthase, partial [Gammaproteobacteria bacterium]|nr:glycogen synthase [Gammaproteobacteria bacterium]
RQTGGLADTVFEEGERANGFVFKEASTMALQAAMERSMECFYDTNRWREKQKNAMSYDYSWDVVTDQWIRLYESLIHQK